jgi:lactoylglutathione lyase
MLYITDPEASLRFYRNYMGMSLVFAQNTGPFTIFYLAYPSLGDVAPADIARSMASRSGLLELVHVHSTDDMTAGDMSDRCGGFGHIGFVVPDVTRALQRARDAGYHVSGSVEDTSKGKMPGLPTSLTNETFSPGFARAFSQLGFVRDPDGYDIFSIAVNELSHRSKDGINSSTLFCEMQT